MKSKMVLPTYPALLPVKAAFPLLNVLPEGRKLMHINGTISVEGGGGGGGKEGGGSIVQYRVYTKQLDLFAVPPSFLFRKWESLRMRLLDNLMNYALVSIKHADEQPAGLSIEVTPIGVEQSLLQLNCRDLS